MASALAGVRGYLLLIRDHVVPLGYGILYRSWKACTPYGGRGEMCRIIFGWKYWLIHAIAELILSRRKKSIVRALLKMNLAKKILNFKKNVNQEICKAFHMKLSRFLKYKRRKRKSLYNNFKNNLVYIRWRILADSCCCRVYPFKEKKIRALLKMNLAKEILNLKKMLTKRYIKLLT